MPVTSQSFLTQANQVGNESNTQSQNGSQSGNTSQSNLFTPGQQGLQGQAAQFASNLLNGQVPAEMGLPQAVWDQAVYNFKQNVLPQLAAQYGAGSPVIGARMNELVMQLTSQSAQNAMSNANQAFANAANWAIQPIGQTQNTSGTNSAHGTTNRTYDRINKDIDVGGLAETGIGALTAMFL